MAETGPIPFGEQDRTSEGKSDKVIGEFLDESKKTPIIDTLGHNAAKSTLITGGLIVNKLTKPPNSDTTRWVPKNKP